MTKVVNTLPKVVLKPGESQQGLFRRFKKTVSNSGILSDIRKKRWFVSKAETRRVEKKKAIRRATRKKPTSGGRNNR